MPGGGVGVDPGVLTGMANIRRVPVGCETVRHSARVVSGRIEHKVLVVDDLDRRRLLALLREYLDARVDTAKVVRIVFPLFAVEIDRRCARSFGVGGHGQFFFGWRLELPQSNMGS